MKAYFELAARLVQAVTVALRRTACEGCDGNDWEGCLGQEKPSLSVWTTMREGVFLLRG